VIASSTWTAIKGRDALQITWDEGSAASLNSAAIHKMLEDAAPKAGAVAEKEGDAASALAQGKKKVEATYEVPFLAHATMEPMNCVAHVQKDQCEIWAPTQDPQGAQKDGASISGLNESKVTVHTTLLGGGFGRRFDNDFVRDALQVSKAVGAPVQVVWTREDDMQHDGYRPVSLHRLAASLDDKGQLTAFTHKIVAPSISGSRWPNSVKNGLDESAVEGAVGMQYSIPNVLVEFVMTNNAVPIWFWRSVYPSQNVFALECFIDELAHAAGKDPYEFRLQHVTKAPRMKAALELAAEKSGWGKPLPKGRYRGIACSPPAFFQTPVVQVAEVSVSPAGVMRVHRVVCAVDCGIVINPDTAAAQIEGAIVYGLSAALKEEITIDKGRVVQSNFDDFPLLTIDEMPEVEVHFVKSTNPPSGTGEPGLPAIAPAVANAVFAATGKRVRQLPIRVKA
jgi:CO/xanthine dehydrogenase Mo-binding subunit